MSSECSRRVRLRDCSVRNRTSVSTTGSERRLSSFSGESKKNPPNGVRVAAVDFEPVRVRAADELPVALNDLIDGHDVGGTEDKEDVVVPQEHDYMGRDSTGTVPRADLGIHRNRHHLSWSDTRRVL